MRRINNDIKQKNIRPLYLLYGDEAYLKRFCKASLVRALVQEGDHMNLSVYSGPRTDLDAALEMADTLPFFAPKRVLLFEDTGLFKKSNEQLAAYIPKIPPESCLIFVEDEVDKRSKTFKAAQKVDGVFELSRPSDAELKKWILGRIQKAGRKITASAYAAFFQRSHASMDLMEMELEKLISYCADSGEITREAVETLCAENPDSKVFDLIDALGEKNQKKAFHIYRDMLRQNQSAMGIMALLARNFRQLLIVSSMERQRCSEKDMLAALSLRFPGILRKMKASARNFSERQLAGALEQAAAYDAAIKSGTLTDTMAVELLISGIV